jgi:hypothetical protein
VGKEHGDDRGNAAAVTAELLRRGAADQEVRGLLPQAGAWPAELVKRMRRVDADNTAALKRIIAEIGWPLRSVVGEAAAEAAWLIVQHTPDPEFQNRARDLMAEAVARGEASPAHLAYLIDRCLVARGREQLYGTQYVDTGDGRGWRLRPVSDPERLDERRAYVGLGPHAEHDQRIREGRP